VATTTVFESQLAVEAHMISDLLRQVEIPSQVLGEYLQTGAGELPVGNLVRVVVGGEHAAEARAVIAEWESAQPAMPLTAAIGPTPVVGVSRYVLVFVLGALAGAAVMWAAQQDSATALDNDRGTEPLAP